MKTTKKILSTFILLLTGMIFIGSAASAQVMKIDKTNFPDAAIRNALNDLSNELYKNNSMNNRQDSIKVEPGYINTENVDILEIEYGTVTSLTGLESFDNLSYLNIYNFSGSSISLSNSFKNTDSVFGIDIRIGNSTADVVDINLPNAVGEISLENQKTRTLNINAPKLFSLRISGNDKLNTIHLKSIASLEYFMMEQVNCTSIHLPDCSNLKWLSINDTKISSIEGLAQLKNLEEFLVTYCKLGNLDFSSNNKLKLLCCTGNEMTTLTAPASIIEIDCSDNKLTTLNVSNCKNLTYLSANGNKLNGKDLDLKNCKKLKCLYLCGNKKLNSINLTKNKQLQYLDISDTNLKSLNLKNNKKIKDISFEKTKIRKLNLTNYKYLCINFSAKKGKKIHLKNFLGTGYKCTKKSSYAKYDKKTNTITITKNKKYSPEFIVLKKGKRKYKILLYFKWVLHMFPLIM